ncbi:hypothetical protein J2T57_001485 [Natronocella acetinitrilica]|uniref:Uncharacterized protein n=1 Tax=Natronocella acetinitrilica TaxID=414046 RepID=A0AAE3G4R7_9GAMM|nr:hypothetical protein [Natronocella acetinitrilica]
MAAVTLASALILTGCISEIGTESASCEHEIEEITFTVD